MIDHLFACTHQDQQTNVLQSAKKVLHVLKRSMSRARIGEELASLPKDLQAVEKKALCLFKPKYSKKGLRDARDDRAAVEIVAERLRGVEDDQLTLDELRNITQLRRLELNFQSHQRDSVEKHATASKLHSRRWIPKIVKCSPCSTSRSSPTKRRPISWGSPTPEFENATFERSVG